jgi:hypothetical protein
MADKHLNFCKLCVRDRVRKHRQEFPELHAALDRAKYQRYAADPAYVSKKRDYAKQWRTSLKNIAHLMAKRHLRKERPAVCDWCHVREPRVAHHEDYSKPLSVDWLCYKCHASVISGPREATA